MLGKGIFVEIKVLHRQGKSIREISRLLGVSRNTSQTCVFRRKVITDSGIN